MAEAMSLGKPVIATGYSGNLDFMTPETSYLVPWRYGTVPVGCSPYPAGARWAEPDLDAAARFMREVYEDPALAAKVGERAKAFVLDNHGVAARAPLMTARFAAAQRVLRRKRKSVAHRHRASRSPGSPVACRHCCQPATVGRTEQPSPFCPRPPAIRLASAAVP